MSADPLQDSVDVLTVVYNNYNHDNMEIFTAPYLGGVDGDGGSWLRDHR